MNTAPATRRSLGGRTDESEAGFTLIEVMVVVMIIGILLAIGIPTFMGARSRAQDRSAESSLRIAQTTAMVVYTDTSDFSTVTVTSLRAAEPGFTWLSSNSKSTNDMRISVASNKAGTEWAAAALSDSGTCFYIRVRETAATLYGKSSTSSCTGKSALRVTGSKW